MSFTSKRLLTKSKRSVLTEGDPYFDSTVLLLHGDGANNAQNNTFLDSSTNNLTITRNGTPTQGSFSPYALNGVAYSPTIHGGGAYFPGVNSNYLSVPSNASFNFTSGTFTVECWIRANAVASDTYQCIVGNYNSTTTGWEIQIDNTVNINFSGDVPDITGTTILQPNVWYHIAVSGSTGSYKLYVNGVQEGATYTGATSLAGGNLGIGAVGDRSGYVGSIPLNGYISNLRITNGTALYTSNFTPPTSPVTLTSNGGATPSTAPTSGQVALLCDFTNGGIFDNTKKNVLTTVGDAKVSTSIVKYGTGAMYFDGNGDYLTVPANTAFNFANGTPFTVEFWMNPLDYGSGTGFNGARTIISTGKVFNAGWRIESFGTSITFYTYNNAIAISTPISLNTWTHIAVVHDGTTTRMYKDGVLVGSANATWSASVSELVIGAIMSGSFTYFYNGYIDDLRITKGIARYTSNFTPPTRALPDTLPTASYSDPYFDNTVLLLHGDGANNAQNNTFLDSSTNNFTITRSGSATQGSFSPYALNGSAYSPTIHGGGAYFPGVNSNYLSVPSNAAFNFSSGIFTVECWCMTTNASAIQTPLANYNSTTTGWVIQIYLNKFIAIFSGDTLDIQGTTTVLPNVWYHVAISGSAGSYKLFINGVQEGSTYTGATSLAGGNLGIGAIGDRIGSVGIYPMVGYISNARIVNGRACYTSNFTPPTSPVTLTSNGGATPSTAPTSGQVALLCDFTNGGIFDNTKKNVLTTVGDAKVSTSIVKYGTGAMYFDGTGDRLTIPSSTNFEFGTGNFTIEFWVNCTNLAGGNAGEMGVVCFRQSSTNEARPSIFIVGNGFVYITNQTGRIASSTISANTWYHVTVSRSSGTTKMFVNGIKAGSDYVDSNSYLISGPIIGDFVLGGYAYNGYIDDLRITKGIARYTSNFTPPTRALPDK